MKKLAAWWRVWVCVSARTDPSLNISASLVGWDGSRDVSCWLLRGYTRIWCAAGYLRFRDGSSEELGDVTTGHPGHPAASRRAGWKWRFGQMRRQVSQFKCASGSGPVSNGFPATIPSKTFRRSENTHPELFIFYLYGVCSEERPWLGPWGGDIPNGVPAHGGSTRRERIRRVYHQQRRQA